jgi:hypothetical protein
METSYLSGAPEWGTCPTQHFGFAKILPHLDNVYREFENKN